MLSTGFQADTLNTKQQNITLDPTKTQTTIEEGDAVEFTGRSQGESSSERRPKPGEVAIVLTNDRSERPYHLRTATGRRYWAKTKDVRFVARPGKHVTSESARAELLVIRGPSWPSLPPHWTPRSSVLITGASPSTTVVIQHTEPTRQASDGLVTEPGRIIGLIQSCTDPSRSIHTGFGSAFETTATTTTTTTTTTTSSSSIPVACRVQWVSGRVSEHRIHPQHASELMFSTPILGRFEAHPASYVPGSLVIRAPMESPLDFTHDAVSTSISASRLAPCSDMGSWMCNEVGMVRRIVSCGLIEIMVDRHRRYVCRHSDVLPAPQPGSLVTPKNARPGFRVVRAPDWRSQDADGVKGNVGTITEEMGAIFPDLCAVLWPSPDSPSKVAIPAVHAIGAGGISELAFASNPYASSTVGGNRSSIPSAKSIEALLPGEIVELRATSAKIYQSHSSECPMNGAYPALVVARLDEGDGAANSGKGSANSRSSSASGGSSSNSSNSKSLGKSSGVDLDPSGSVVVEQLGSRYHVLQEALRPLTLEAVTESNAVVGLSVIPAADLLGSGIAFGLNGVITSVLAGGWALVRFSNALADQRVRIGAGDMYDLAVAPVLECTLPIFAVGDQVVLSSRYIALSDEEVGPLEPGTVGVVVEVDDSDKPYFVRNPNGSQWWYARKALAKYEKSAMSRNLAQVRIGCFPSGCRASSTNESGRFRHTASKLFSPTLRESPASAHAISHALLLRAGFIRQNGAGIYTYMPLAQRVLTKITSLVDKNMIVIDGQKVTMPLFIPASSWKKSGRWETAGPELIRLHDRNNGEYCLSPTHEEIVTEIVANEVSSHKQLPMKIYQIGTKFRDEARPRFGLMRGREFVMKDMYSFHVDRADAEMAYRQVSEAYHKIFKSLGVEYRMVEADNGNMGGSLSHEFHILSNIGEDQLFFCDTCNYAANIEKATSKFTVTDTKKLLSELLDAKDRVDFVKKVTSLSNIGASWFKLQRANQETSVALSIMGSHEANATKIRVATKALEVIPIGNNTDSYQPNDLTIMIDETLFKHPESASFLEKIKGKFDIVIGDFRNASTGDECPVQNCDGHLNSRRGIEVGHVFYLGTKYSVSMGAMINDPATNKKMPIEMGCYGIGVSRVMAAVVESSHDSHGIIWPMSIAPFRICIVDMLKESNEAVELYDLLSGIEPFKDEVILDDRDKSAGVKLNDASLIGYPVVVVMGKFMKTDRNIEIHIRQTKEKLLIPYSEALQYFEKLAQTIPSI